MGPDEFVVVSNIRTDYGDLTELAHSIAMVGVEVPILYYRQDGLNVVWDGHRRLRCVRIVNTAHAMETRNSAAIYNGLKDAGLLDGASIQMVNLKDITLRVPVTDIPAIEVPAPDSDEDLALFQLIAAKEGLRKPLNPIEEAQAIRILLKGRSGQEVAHVLGKSEAYVSRRHRLVDLHPEFQAAVAEGRLEPRSAEQLLTLSQDAMEDEDLRRSLIAAKTGRKIRTKVLAANAAAQVVAEGEGEEITIDPLMIALREEAKLKVAAAVSAVKELHEVYQEVDQKPSLTELVSATKWLRGG